MTTEYHIWGECCRDATPSCPGSPTKFTVLSLAYILSMQSKECIDRELKMRLLSNHLE